MKGLLPLILGIFGTFAFSWTGLIFVPNIQIGHLNPQTDEDGNDPYPAPQSGMAARGHRVYVANGCIYCHSQQVRADYAGSDIERKWGERRSAPRDYIFEHPVVLGKMRIGPDLANIGHRAPVTDENAAPAPAAALPAPAAAPAAGASPVASSAPVASAAGTAAASAPAAPAISPAPPSNTTSAPPISVPSPAAAAAPALPGAVTTIVNGAALPYSAAWHHRHLYDPRSVSGDSNMPAYRFLYEKRKISGERSADAVTFDAASENAPPEGWEVVPTDDARCLVAYLMSLDQTHPLNEVKSAAVSPSAPGKAVK